MRFVDRFFRLVGLLSLVVLLVVVASYAFASALLLPQQGGQVDVSAGEDETATTIASTDAPTNQPAAANPPPSSINAPVAETAVGTVSCTRSVEDEPFTVQVMSADRHPEPLVVAVDLVTADGMRQRRTIEAAVVDPAASTAAAVADSTGPGYTNCAVVAVQHGDRVILTG